MARLDYFISRPGPWATRPVHTSSACNVSHTSVLLVSHQLQATLLVRA